MFFVIYFEEIVKAVFLIYVDLQNIKWHDVMALAILNAKGIFIIKSIKFNFYTNQRTDLGSSNLVASNFPLKPI